MRYIGINPNTKKPVFSGSFVEADSYGFPLSMSLQMTIENNGELSFDDYIGKALSVLWDDDKIALKIVEALQDNNFNVTIGLVKERIALLCRYYYCDDKSSGLVKTGKAIMDAANSMKITPFKYWEY